MVLNYIPTNDSSIFFIRVLEENISYRLWSLHTHTVLQYLPVRLYIWVPYKYLENPLLMVTSSVSIWWIKTLLKDDDIHETGKREKSRRGRVDVRSRTTEVWLVLFLNWKKKHNPVVYFRDDMCMLWSSPGLYIQMQLVTTARGKIETKDNDPSAWYCRHCVRLFA